MCTHLIQIMPQLLSCYLLMVCDLVLISVRTCELCYVLCKEQNTLKDSIWLRFPISYLDYGNLYTTLDNITY